MSLVQWFLGFNKGRILDKLSLIVDCLGPTRFKRQTQGISFVNLYSGENLTHNMYNLV